MDVKRLRKNTETGKASYSLKKVRNNYSVNRKFHMLGLGLNSGLHHETTANRSLRHGLRNYGIGFTVNRVSSNEIRQNHQIFQESKLGNTPTAGN
jgi:hypothetical protein